MDSKTSDSGVYVARFGFNLRTVLAIIGCLAFMILFIWIPIDEDTRHPDRLLLAKVIGIPFFGIIGLASAVAAVRGIVGLRVDQHGITLGALPMPLPGSSRRPLHVAWQHVDEVVLFDMYMSSVSCPCIGLRLRPEAQGIPTTSNPDIWWMSPAKPGRGPDYDHVPRDILERSRPVSGWLLDEQRLIEAITRYAPDVQVVRLNKHGKRQRVRAA